MSANETKLRWGIIGAGGIAKAFAKGVQHSKTGEMVAVGSRSQEKADAFAKELNIPRSYGSYEALLADKDVQAVYIATPHPMHAEWAIKAAEAGKHILCEKPAALNYYELMAMIESAKDNNVFFMEAFMYRCHPQTRKLVELLREKVIGEVRVIQTAFSFHAGYNPEGRLFKNQLGGGGILDVGCYCTSMCRLVAGAALGKDFAEPVSVKGFGHLGASNADEWAVATAKFDNDIVATLATGVAVNQENVVRIFGTEGNIFIPSPWIPSREGGATKIIVKRNDEKEPREISIQTDEWLYGIEADTVAENLEARQAKSPAMSWNDSMGNIRMLDMWRREIDLVYEAEKPEVFTVPVHKHPLAVKAGCKMKYGTIAGLEKQVSRLVMGVDNQNTFPHAAVIFDDFFERGGNCFDSAHIYGGGRCEQVLGQWVKSRNLRDKVVILDKGAHTPFCDPVHLTRELMVSLDRIQTDHLDIYMMHRDNPDIHVGEFIDVLNEHVKAGRIKAFGASNWSIGRVKKANAYAKRKGLAGFSAVSNNFSLARMVNPVWDGCIAASDPDSRKWFRKSQMPLMPWSSQARGFFVPERGRPDLKSDQSLVHCWYSDDNFQRQARAIELAKKKNVQPVTIALAYVLCQPFPTFPLIGPRAISETKSSFEALTCELTPKELKWLNLEI
ncbi:MAG TPA: oxidoreductase [Lentisphaeria bacterium]|nr:MAG: oxidoreductase [Lentisphaerae bacterium GWF2_50_93]HCE46540.1 oxidoreductase [Lentisphaeria bacterium]